MSAKISCPVNLWWAPPLHLSPVKHLLSRISASRPPCHRRCSSDAVIKPCQPCLSDFQMNLSVGGGEVWGNLKYLVISRPRTLLAPSPFFLHTRTVLAVCCVFHTAMFAGRTGCELTLWFECVMSQRCPLSTIEAAG